MCLYFTLHISGVPILYWNLEHVIKMAHPRRDAHSTRDQVDFLSSVGSYTVDTHLATVSTSDILGLKGYISFVTFDPLHNITIVRSWCQALRGND